MATCHSCKTSEAIKSGLYKDTPFSQIPCSTCTLNESSLGTFELKEGHIANSSEDNPDDEAWTREAADGQSPQPYAVLDGDDPDDPRIPLSTLVSAMSLFLSLSIKERKALQLRMLHLSYARCGLRMGCTRQAVEKLLAQALMTKPLLRHLLPGKSGRGATPISPTHTSAVGDGGSGSKKCNTALHKASFTHRCATRDSA